MNYFFAISVAILSTIIVIIYNERHFNKERKLNLSETIKYNKLIFPITLVVYICVAIGSVLMFQHSDYGMDAMYRWLVLMYGAFLIAYIDIKERIVPNITIIALLAIRVGFIVYEAIIAFDSIKLVFISPLLGMLIGGGIILLAMLISRKSVGMGDVKLFAIIGLYVGSKSIIPTLFCTFFFSAIFGLVLLIFKKAKIKDTMPMAPFAAAGILVNFVLSYIGG